MIWQTSSTSSDDTERLGGLLGSQLKGGEVIELRADLGGGKTTLVRGIAQGAGSQDRVSSPTFTLSRVYKTNHFNITHFDFYRLDEPGLLADQLSEAIDNGDVVIVEWADVVNDVLPSEQLAIELKPTANSPDERQITISYPESKSQVIEYIRTEFEQVRP